jgi:hypothetical protein
MNWYKWCTPWAKVTETADWRQEFTVKNFLKIDNRRRKRLGG